MHYKVYCIPMTVRALLPPPEPADKWEVQLRKGCLELAVLAALWSERLYGLEIMRRLEDGSGLVVPEGTVYPLLSRLKSEGLYFHGGRWKRQYI